jgi:YD repeat-containing protein
MTIRTTVLPGGTPQVSIDATANAETYQLPAGYAAGRRLIIRRVDSGATYTATVTVPTGGSIDGVTDGTLTLEVTFEAGDGNAWQTTGSLKAIAAAVAARPELTGTYGQLLPAASSYTYNADGSIATETVAGITTTYTYNTDGSIATMVRSGVTRTFTYNTDGTIASVA